ncbi:MAG: prepilin-type N-terminal cleavage/methylation domain-containing protein [Rhodospirillaceae bacterium]|nr:prepilin-type N-terminal cleavage/methylation domain-containing protein [Rhodospirillaceae bacterium]
MQRGFTLLEVLVVLAMVGLLSALALPQFSVISDRLDFTLKRESFERELSGLGYRAFTEGQPLVLSGQYPRDPKRASPAPEIEDPYSTASLELGLAPGQYRVLQPVMANDAPLMLPKDWRLTAETPVIYQVSGFCGGGSVSLAVGTQRYVYTLKAPECRVELVR